MGAFMEAMENFSYSGQPYREVSDLCHQLEKLSVAISCSFRMDRSALHVQSTFTESLNWLQEGLDNYGQVRATTNLRQIRTYFCTLWPRLRTGAHLCRSPSRDGHSWLEVAGALEKMPASSTPAEYMESPPRL